MSEENPLSSKDERVLLQLYRGVLALGNVARSEFGGNSQLFSDALDYFDEKDNDRVPHKTSDLVTLLVSYLKFVQLIYDHIEREQDTYEKAVKRVRDGRVSNMQLDFLDRAALLADLHKLDTISPAVLDTMPLFSDNGEAPFGKHWPSLKRAMQATEHGWDVWEQYYWNRPGTDSNERLIEAVNRFSSEDWSEAPWKVNALLAEMTAPEPAGFGEEEQEEISNLTIHRSLQNPKVLM